MRIPESVRRGLPWLRRVASRCERTMWIALVAAALLLQWPMLKGYYYRAAGTAVPHTAIGWRTDLHEALGEAARTKKQVLVDFSADWCAPCIAMKHDVWPDPAVVRALTASYVPLLVDVDLNAELASLYKVDGIPTVLVLDDGGRVVRQASMLSARSAAAMVAFLTDTE